MDESWMTLEPLVNITQKGDGFYWLKDNIYPTDPPEVVLVANDYNGRMMLRPGRLIPVPIVQAISDYPEGLIGASDIPSPNLPDIPAGSKLVFKDGKLHTA